MSRFIPGNHLTLLCNGAQYFPALISAIDHAKTAIFLETYIFSADTTGYAVATALSAAARRGVAVQVLMDGYGSKAYSDEPLLNGMRAAGVRIALYRPDLFRNVWKRTRLRRLHRKLVVIDGTIGFIGGINVIDDLHTPKHTPPRIDFAVRVTGPVLGQMVAATSRLWNIVRVSNPTDRLPRAEPMETAAIATGEILAKVEVRDNFRNRNSIEYAYLAAIRNAQSHVTLANAYFLPGQRFRRELVAAAARGVRVRLLVQARTEYALLNWAGRALYGQLLGGGVEIYEYTHSFLHAKVASVDDGWATVGSSNIDPFSLLLAREANIVVRDQGFAMELRNEVEALIEKGATQLAQDKWSERSLAIRALHWTTYGFVRAMVAFFAFGARDYRT
jgi:cardiolipin synthase A/B